MKKVLLLPFVLSVLFTQQVFSQHHEDHKENAKEEVSEKGAQWAKEMTQKVDEICNLSSDQEKKVMQTNLKFADRLQELKAEKDLTKEEMARRKDDILRNLLQEYDPILTNEQKTQLKAKWDDITSKE